MEFHENEPRLFRSLRIDLLWKTNQSNLGVSDTEWLIKCLVTPTFGVTKRARLARNK
jgi:hypothetical protein